MTEYVYNPISTDQITSKSKQIINGNTLNV